MNRIGSPAFQFDLIDPLMAVTKNTSCFDSLPWWVAFIAFSSLLIHGIIMSNEYSKGSWTYKCRYPNVNDFSIFELFRFLRNLLGNPLLLLSISLSLVIELTMLTILPFYTLLVTTDPPRFPLKNHIMPSNKILPLSPVLMISKDWPLS